MKKKRKLHKHDSNRYHAMIELIDTMPFVEWNAKTNSCLENALDFLDHGKTLIAFKLIEVDGMLGLGYHHFLRKHENFICIYNNIDSFGSNIVLYPEMIFSADDPELFQFVSNFPKLNWDGFKVDEKDLFAYAIINEEEAMVHSIAKLEKLKNAVGRIKGDSCEMMVLDAAKIKKENLRFEKL